MSKSVFRFSEDLQYRSYTYDWNVTDTRALMAREHPAKMKRESIADWWTPVPCFPKNPMTEAGDFFTAGTLGRFGVSDRVFEDKIARGLLEEAGELLPLEVPEEGHMIYFFRNTARGLCPEALDAEKTSDRDYFNLKLVFFSRTTI